MYVLLGLRVGVVVYDDGWSLDHLPVGRGLAPSNSTLNSSISIFSAQ